MSRGRPDRPRLPPTPVTSRRDARCRAGGTGDTAGDTPSVLSPAGRHIARILATCRREGMANGGGLEIHSTPSRVAKALSKPFPSAPLASPRPYNYLRGREQPVAETVPNSQPSFSPQAFDFHRASAGLQGHGGSRRIMKEGRSGVQGQSRRHETAPGRGRTGRASRMWPTCWRWG